MTSAPISHSAREQESVWISRDVGVFQRYALQQAMESKRALLVPVEVPTDALCYVESCVSAGSVDYARRVISTRINQQNEEVWHCRNC